MTTPTLSKTKFMAGRQCAKRLHLEVYQPELKEPMDSAMQSIAEAGHAVGTLAHGLYPGGRLIDARPEQLTRAVRLTRAALADPTVPAIFEPTLLAQGTDVRADILVRVHDDVFDLVEVKSGSEVTEDHIFDAAVQRHVIGTAGVKIRQVLIAVPSKEFVRDAGPIDPRAYFLLQDVTNETEILLPDVQATLVSQRAVLADPDTVPAVKTGSHCKTPVKCPFFGLCHANQTLHPIGQIPRLHKTKRAMLEEMGVDDIRQIPEDFPLSDRQHRVRAAVQTGVPFFDDAAVREVLGGWEWPLNFLDFEAVQSAIPLYAGTRPYQVVPFQFSNHTLFQNGKRYHKGFLHAEEGDPRPRFLRNMLDTLKTKGSIVVYSGYEEARLRDLIADLPRFVNDLPKTPKAQTKDAKIAHYTARVEQVIGRLQDLLVVVRDHMYFPEFQGSNSVKYVLPALVPGMSYADLQIKNGMEAAAAFLRVQDPATLFEERVQLSSALEKYCHRDTDAMVEIFLAILRRANVQVKAPTTPARRNRAVGV